MHKIKNYAISKPLFNSSGIVYFIYCHIHIIVYYTQDSIYRIYTWTSKQKDTP